MKQEIYEAYLRILHAELVPALGCTEPIAIAYAAAKARELLGCLPAATNVEASGNIIKNVKSVIVPGTGGMKGIEAAAAAGAVAGDAARELEVIAGITDTQRAEIADFVAGGSITTGAAQSDLVFDLIVTMTAPGHKSVVRIINDHTNIVYLEQDGRVLLQKDDHTYHSGQDGLTRDKALLNMADILDFADTVDLDRVAPLMDRQIAYNTAISDEGLAHPYGANVGKVILKYQGQDVRCRAKAAAAAGSDARMSGCELPVVINSGSGNQGITITMPIVVYSRQLGASEEKRCRALVLANLIAIYEKVGIGTLSAYCGAVSAGCAAGAGIAYLHGGGMKEIAHTVVNSLAIASGIVCDGAKASCAAKIATAVEAGIMGYEMFLDGQQFYGGDGFVKKGVDNTIRAVGRLASSGMKYTDREILDIMLH